MLKRFNLLLVAVMVSTGMYSLCSAKPKTTTQVEITTIIPQLANQQISLGKYVMGKYYVEDSLLLDKKGRGIFKKQEPLPEGQYFLYKSGRQYCDLLIGKDQIFTVTISDTLPANLLLSMSIEGADMTRDFLEYTKLMSNMQRKANGLVQKKNESADEKEKSIIDKELADMGDAVKVRQVELKNQYRGEMLELFIRELQYPQYEKNNSLPDSLDAINKYAFYRDHYLDSLDLGDIRTYKTSYIKTTLSTYLDKVLVQQYDSIMPQALRLIERSLSDSACFRIMCPYVMDYAVNSRLMGMDNIWVRIGRDYYLSGKANWADTTWLKNLEKEIDKIETSLVGMQAANVELCGIDGTYRRIYDMEGEQLTILFFYEPQCGHCRKTTPLMRDFYEKYKDDPRLNVIAIYMLTDQEEWLNFIKEQKTEIFNNVWDPERRSWYWHWYDTSTTPSIYVIDKNHKIFAKKIDVETLEMIAKYELK